MIHPGSMSESFSSWSMSRTMSRSAASRPVFRVLQRAWRMYSTDSFEFDLINSGKWPHKLRSILSTVSCLPQQNNATPCSKFSLEFEVKTLLALEVEVKSCEWERVSHVPLPVPSTSYCASLLFIIETAWLTGKRLERVSCFVFGLLVVWTLSWGSIGLKMIL